MFFLILKEAPCADSARSLCVKIKVEITEAAARQVWESKLSHRTPNVSGDL